MTKHIRFIFTYFLIALGESFLIGRAIPCCQLELGGCFFEKKYGRSLELFRRQWT